MPPEEVYTFWKKNLANENLVHNLDIYFIQQGVCHMDDLTKFSHPQTQMRELRPKNASSLTYLTRINDIYDALNFIFHIPGDITIEKDDNGVNIHPWNNGKFDYYIREAASRFDRTFQKSNNKHYKIVKTDAEDLHIYIRGEHFFFNLVSLLLCSDLLADY